MRKQTPAPHKHQIPSEPDKEDRKLLAGKSRSYIYGWNKVKYANKKTSLC